MARMKPATAEEVQQIKAHFEAQGYGIISDETALAQTDLLKHLRKEAKANKPKGPTPERYAEAGTEHAHQVALFMCAAQPEVREEYPELSDMFAIPNGGERHAAVAAKLKAEGVKKAVSDIFLPKPIAHFAGLFIEMKKPGETARKDQDDFGNRMRLRGYGYVCCDHWEKARDIIINYLNYTG